MVTWYAVKCWKMTSPEGVQIVGTKPSHLWTWTMWTVTRDDSTTAQVPQELRRKYQHLRMGMAYSANYDGVNQETFPEAALVRIEHDEGDILLEEEDYNVLLDTQPKWDQLYTLHPALIGRWADQPAPS